MNSSFGTGGFDASQSNTGGVPAEKKAEGIAPMFIKQILDSSEDGLNLFGLNIGMVKFVAIVRNVEHSSTKITYRLEDHTGQIDAHHWLEEGDTLNAPQVVINAYARVYGSVRNQGGGKTVIIFNLTPVGTANELTNHMLEVLNAFYKAEDISKAGAINNGSSQFTSDFGSGMGGSTENQPGLGLNAKQKLVYDAVRNHLTEQGISLQELQKKFSHMSSNELSNILDHMTTEGHIYTSTDSEHFLATDQ